MKKILVSSQIILKIIFFALIFSLIISSNLLSMEEEDTYKSNNLKISKAYALATIGKSNTSAIYMNISSYKKDVIQKVYSPQSKMVHIHESYLNKNKVMKMKKISNFRLEKNKVYHFQPGGIHFMIMGLNKKLKHGDQLTLFINLKNSDTVKLIIPVVNNN